MSNALDVATHPDVREAELRHSGVRLAVELLIGRRPNEAYVVMLTSVEQQARVQGIAANLWGQP